MKSEDGGTPNLLFKMPRLAERMAKGTRILSMRRAPWEKGSNTGMSLYTASREKEEIDAMFPVLKKAD